MGREKIMLTLWIWKSYERSDKGRIERRKPARAL
jgi:hypothetical protein